MNKNLCSIHDRKLSVLGLCRLLTMPIDVRPQAVATYADQMLPNIILLLHALQHAYQEKAQKKHDDFEEERFVAEILQRQKPIDNNAATMRQSR